MIRYAFELFNYRSWLVGLSKVMNVSAKGGRIMLPSYLGQGYIAADNITEHISYVIMNCTFKEDLVLLRKRSTYYGMSLFFNQEYITEFFSIREPNNALTDKTPHRSNIYLAPTNYEMEITWSRGSRLRRVGIYFSPVFIRKLIKRETLRDLLMYADNRLLNIPQEPISFEYRKSLEEIFNADLNSPVCRALFQNRTLTLSEKFFQSFILRAPMRKQAGLLKLRRSREQDIEALRNVHKFLTSKEFDRFPTIVELSKMAMMSTTKLKERFKQMYGMNLYEVYNRNRLAKARELLQVGKYGVREVGMRIGYTNLSNFAKAFKKEFGLLPREVLKGEPPRDPNAPNANTRKTGSGANTTNPKNTPGPRPPQ